MKKIILISGGSDGLGKALATQLSKHHQVVILARNEEKLEAAAREINCDSYVCDVTNYDQIEKAVHYVVSKYHRLDVLINNAGLWMMGQLEDNEPEKIKTLLEVNTLGPIYLTKACVPQFKQQRSGMIVNVISRDGTCTKANRSVYHASKWAMAGFTNCIQHDLAPHGIQITGLYPGLLKTKLFEKNGVVRDLSEAIEPSEVAKSVEYIINLPPNVVIPDLGIRSINYKCSRDCA